MQFSTLLRQLTHSATGVPRLARAGHRAGLTTPQVGQLLLISVLASSAGARVGARRPHLQNATRHFVWQALLTAWFGREVAVEIGQAQEVGTPDLADSRVDQHNNAVGQAYGAHRAAELRDLGLSRAVRELVPEALRLFDEGELSRK